MHITPATQNASFSFGSLSARAAQASGGNVVETGRGAGFAAEMSLANQDLRSAWSGLGDDVLPHFGHAPRF